MAQATTGTVLVADRGPVRTLAIDRPDRRNALDHATIERLLAEVEAAPAAGARVVVLTGTGTLAFSAGYDLKEVEPVDLDAEALTAHRARLIDLFLAIHGSQVPVVARVNGAALGAGLGLALVCDLVVMADHAVLATPEIDVGRWPMAVGAVLLRTAPGRLAGEMMMTARRIAAVEAHAAGLVDRVVPPDALDAATDELADVLAAKPPRMLALGRRTMRDLRTPGRPLADDLAVARARLAEVIDGDEAVERLAAFRGAG
jgi:enoyl-CoA hydratase/carnithine racemase